MNKRFVKGLVSWIVQVLINMGIDNINEFVKVAYLAILWPSFLSKHLWIS